jgi:hypothetical protein
MPMFKDFPKAKDTPSSDVVGTIRTGKMDPRTNTPYSLESFRFTADHPDITAKLAELYGGKPGEWETAKPDKFELLSETNVLAVEVRHFDSEFILWGANKPIRVCDGQNQKDDDGDECQCPGDYWEHRDMAAKGKACKPNVSSKLILLDAPELGMFKFSSGSWLLASDVDEIEAFLADADHNSQMYFSIETYQTKQGQTRQRPRFSPTKELVSK